MTYSEWLDMTFRIPALRENQLRDNQHRRYFYGIAPIKRIITTCTCGVRFCHTAPNQTRCEACRTGEPGEA